VFSGILAVAQDSRALAVVGLSGGFLAPLLCSSGVGNHLVLFSYYALLNAGVLGIAWHKSWRLLNLLGFVATFGIGSIWGILSYDHSRYFSTQPFLILYFLIYLAVTILFTLRQPTERRGFIDTTLIFGTPTITFALQAGLVRPFEHGPALSAFVACLIYLTLAYFLSRRRAAQTQLLFESSVAIGITFLTITLPLALDPHATGTFWALEGAGLVWIGLRQQRRIARVTGLLLQVIAGFIFLDRLINHPVLAQLPLANAFFFTGATLALAAWATGWFYRRRTTESDPISLIALLIGLLWWSLTGTIEIDRFVPPPLIYGAMILFGSIIGLTGDLLHRPLKWDRVLQISSLLIPFLIACALIPIAQASHPAAKGGLVAWPIAFGTVYWILWRNNQSQLTKTIQLQHACATWLLTFLIAGELVWQVHQAIPTNRAWGWLPVIIVPTVVMAIIRRAPHWLQWPLRRHRSLYLTVITIPIAIVALIIILLANLVSPGSMDPMPAIPLLNFFDLSMALALMVILFWIILAIREGAESPAPLIKSIGRLSAATAFVWLSGIIVRGFHHHAAVPFTVEGLLASPELQATLSIFWTSLGFAAMLVASSRRWHSLWVTGAIVLACVVLKLFAIDTSHAGTIGRIISFTGVGALLLAVGYFCPKPPREGVSDITSD